MRDETALHRMQVHVLEFLDELLLTPEVEIVEAGPPGRSAQKRAWMQV
jgi:hypothetical protein